MNAINTDKKVQLTYGGLKSSTDTSGADYTIIGIPFDIRTTYHIINGKKTPRIIRHGVKFLLSIQIS